MNLVELKKYLMAVKIASLTKICEHFHVDAGLLRNMLAHWLHKGCVRKFTQAPACGKTCMKCVPPLVEIYEWVT